MMRVSQCPAFAAALLVTTACDGSGTPRTPLAPTDTVAAVAIISGNNQHAKAGEPFAAPLVVRVTDPPAKASAMRK